MSWWLCVDVKHENLYELHSQKTCNDSLKKLYTQRLQQLKYSVKRCHAILITMTNQSNLSVKLAVLTETQLEESDYFIVVNIRATCAVSRKDRKAKGKGIVFTILHVSLDRPFLNIGCSCFFVLSTLFSSTELICS